MLPGGVLSAHQIEIFNILPVQFEGKAFESDDFHEFLTLLLPFDRDVATVRRLLFLGILAGNFTPVSKPCIDSHCVISRRDASKQVFALLIGSRIKMLLVLFAFEQDVAVGNRITGI